MEEEKKHKENCECGDCEDYKKTLQEENRYFERSLEDYEEKEYEKNLIK